MSYVLDNNHILLTVHVQENGQMHLKGKVRHPGKYNEMFVMAANPIDRMTNYSGSGLPFPCPSIAFENTPNYLKVAKDGIIECTFLYPNSYYTLETQLKVIPSIFVSLKQNEKDAEYYQIKLEDTLPLKTTTTYRPAFKSGPEFYAKKETIMGIPPSQEWILRNIGDYKATYELA